MENLVEENLSRGLIVKMMKDQMREVAEKAHKNELKLIWGKGPNDPVFDVGRRKQLLKGK